VATFNEEAEILDLLNSVSQVADFFVVSDDGSTDKTVELAENWGASVLKFEHTGLPETIKARGVDFIKNMFKTDTWILMLDADERIDQATQDKIVTFIRRDAENISHVWFNLVEFIDGVQTRAFLKCRLFRAGAARFSESVHEDDLFEGQGASFGWVVIHRKTKEKQVLREKEYIQTYAKLLNEGKVTQEWVDRCVGFHYFVKEVGLVPHG